MTIHEEILSLKRNDYQRDNFDEFLSHINFSFNIPAIHVAGTNGKGSTCLYLKNIYKKANYKVGLFSSPFFYKINEMISINDDTISDDDIVEIFNKYKKEIYKYNLSSFEVETFIAFEFFKKQNVDLAIIECGMGGELDATNIFNPILSIITSISLEHTSFLGKSLSEIALSKAGIVKPNVPILLPELHDDALNSIVKVAQANKSPIKIANKFNYEKVNVDGYSFDFLEYKNLKIKSCALYSVHDACLAIDATKILNEKFHVNEENIRDGLFDLIIPFRFECISRNPDIILDGGHNPEAIDNLTKTIANIQNNRQIHVIFACFRDKNIQRMLESLSIISDDITLTTFDHPRARTEDEYFLFAADYKFATNYIDAINELKTQYPDDIILVTGSLAFVSYVKRDFFK